MALIVLGLREEALCAARRLGDDSFDFGRGLRVRGRLRSPRARQRERPARHPAACGAAAGHDRDQLGAGSLATGERVRPVLAGHALRAYADLDEPASAGVGHRAGLQRVGLGPSLSGSCDSYAAVAPGSCSGRRASRSRSSSGGTRIANRRPTANNGRRGSLDAESAGDVFRPPRAEHDEHEPRGDPQQRVPPAKTPGADELEHDEQKDDGDTGADDGDPDWSNASSSGTTSRRNRSTKTASSTLNM